MTKDPRFKQSVVNTTGYALGSVFLLSPLAFIQRVRLVHFRRTLGITITNLILLTLVVLVAMPFVYMISASFKPQYEIFTFPVQILPKEPY